MKKTRKPAIANKIVNINRCAKNERGSVDCAFPASSSRWRTVSSCCSGVKRVIMLANHLKVGTNTRSRNESDISTSASVTGSGRSPYSIKRCSSGSWPVFSRCVTYTMPIITAIATIPRIMNSIANLLSDLNLQLDVYNSLDDGSSCSDQSQSDRQHRPTASMVVCQMRHITFIDQI